MWGECISGALYTGDFMSIAKKVGFSDPRVLSQSEIAINDPQMCKLVGNARFFSITYRLFKLPGLLEAACEDYGQIAIYKVCLPHKMISPQQGPLPVLIISITLLLSLKSGASWSICH